MCLRLETLHIRLSDVAVYVVTSCLSGCEFTDSFTWPCEAFPPQQSLLPTLLPLCVAGWCNGQAVGLATPKVAGSTLGRSTFS